MVSCLALLHVAIVAEMRLVRISATLYALIEVDKLSRPQVVKQLWVYIKANDLQNPGNKREIICDDRLRPVFNADKIDMFKMNKVLGSYVSNINLFLLRKVFILFVDISTRRNSPLITLHRYPLC